MNSREILEDLLKLNAPSKREQIVSDYVIKIANKYNIKYQIFNDYIPIEGNCAPILFSIPGNKEDDSILLSAHLDTVNIEHDNPLEFIKEGFLYKSDGNNILGGDDRLGVAAALVMAIKAVQNPNLHSGLEILFSVQEELGCLGSKNFDFKNIKSKINYNLDGEGPVGSVINRAPTKVRYTLKVIGKPSHAALAPEEGNNAIVAISKIISKLPQGQIDDISTTNIGMIFGGKQTNVVTKEATMVAEIRSLDFNRYLKWKDAISNIVDKESQVLNIKYELEFEIQYHGYHVKEERKIIEKFKRACSNKNISPQLLTSQGGGDSNNINFNGIDSVVFGFMMYNIHTLDEYFDIRDYENSLSLLDTIIFN